MTFLYLFCFSTLLQKSIGLHNYIDSSQM